MAVEADRRYLHAMPTDAHPPVVTAPSTEALDRHDEPPVVARMVIEIRSDGTRTIARGAMEDVTLGQKVAIEAEGASPAMLAASLLRSLAQLPFQAMRTNSILKTAVRALLPKKR